MKFTDEQLSRVLTAHARGGLQRGGGADNLSYPGCLFQVALEVEVIPELEKGPQYDYNTKDLSWFDLNYRGDWSVEMFLTELEIRGLA